MEINYNELFGLDAGGNEQEVADPATADTGAAPTQGAGDAGGDATGNPPEATPEGAEGAKAQEVAAPAVEQMKNTAAQPAGNADRAVADDSNAQQTTEAAQQPKEQTPEQNAAFAAARRKAEQERDAAVQQAKQDAEKTIAEAFTKMGLTNPYTKQPITSKAEFDAYQQQYKQERHARILKKTGMSDDEFKQYVDNLPEVREAKQAAEAARQAQEAAQQQEAQAKVQEQLKEIGTLDPSIKTLEDLTKMPNYPEFYEIVKRGLTLTEAYKLANFDVLTKGAAAASRQAAMNAIAGKEHMGATATRGTGAQTVPADVMEQYHMFNPGITDAEIQAHYNKNHKT